MNLNASTAPVSDTETDENCDTSSIEPVRIQLAKKGNKLAEKKYKKHPKSINDALTNRFNCKQFEKDFSSKYYLMEHVQSFHEGVSFKCDCCSKTFNSSNGLRRHVRAIHNGVKFNCDQCPKTYTTKFALRIHTLFVSHVFL